MNNNETVIGVVNWDTSLPSSMRCGSYTIKTLSPSKYRNITPYYADIINDNQIKFHLRSPEEYEKELEYAIYAGIDYFAHTWYDDEKNGESIAWERSYARKLHLQSPLKEKIKMCAIVFDDLSDKTLIKLSEHMKENYYQKACGKPLVYFFGGYNAEFIKRVKSFCGDIYAVFLYGSEDCAGRDYSEADSTSAYCCSCHEMTKYSQLAQLMVERNEERKTYGIGVIPEFTTGWDPSPRVEIPIPGITYRDVDYPSLASEEELLEGARMLTEWIKANRDATPTGHILTFAWNEFEEGGHICPTYTSDGKTIDTSRLEAFKKVIEYFKKELP